MRKYSRGCRQFHRKFMSLFLAVLLSVSASSCGRTKINPNPYPSGEVIIEVTSEEEEEEEYTGKKRKIIIDTDTGADDCSAIILAAKNPNVEILGVTTMVGNVGLEQSNNNALMALEIAGCDAPVHEGSDQRFGGKRIEAASVFGDDGMGDADLIHPKGEIQGNDGVNFIIDMVNQYPGEVEIVSLGPATNIAKAIYRAPDTMKNVKMIWSMGTTGYGPGDASPVAEFNVYNDVQAYRELVSSGVPVTIIGLDMCDGEAMWTNEQFDELEELNDTGKFVAESFGKLRLFYAKNGSEKATMNCDSLAMMCVLHPRFIKSTSKVHASCIVENGETYGQVIFYRQGFTYDQVSNDYDYNVTLVTDVAKGKYFEMYKEAISK